VKFDPLAVDRDEARRLFTRIASGYDDAGQLVDAAVRLRRPETVLAVDDGVLGRGRVGQRADDQRAAVGPAEVALDALMLLAEALNFTDRWYSVGM
jgi:hypothetical protein